MSLFSGTRVSVSWNSRGYLAYCVGTHTVVSISEQRDRKGCCLPTAHRISTPLRVLAEYLLTCRHKNFKTSYFKKRKDHLQGSKMGSVLTGQIETGVVHITINDTTL